MKTPNVFNVLLRSSNSENSAATFSCNFNLGSVLQNAPNLINFQKQSYCKVKVRYFGIKAVHGAGNPLLNVGSIEIHLNVPNPNTLESAAHTGEYQMISSSVIGLVPTESTAFTHANNAYDNDYFYSANVFQGGINISLHNADTGAILAGLTDDHPWHLLLEVCYDDDPARVNDNSGLLNTKNVEYELRY